MSKVSDRTWINQSIHTSGSEDQREGADVQKKLLFYRHVRLC